MHKTRGCPNVILLCGGHCSIVSVYKRSKDLVLLHNCCRRCRGRRRGKAVLQGEVVVVVDAVVDGGVVVVVVARTRISSSYTFRPR